MIAASLLFGLLYLMAPITVGKIAFDMLLTDLTTLNLIAVLVLIMFLEHVMRKTHMLQEIVSSLKELILDRRVVMAILPAFLGFLPSAGGARFSAPMVGEVSSDMALSPERKSFINYWYRHIWEYFFPLYPSIILASKVAGVPLSKLIAVQFPFSVVAVLVGIPIAFRGITSGGLSAHTDPDKPSSDLKRQSAHHREALLRFFLCASPILIPVALVISGRVEVLPALALTLLGLLAAKRYNTTMVCDMVREGFSFNIVFLVVGVMLFKNILTHSGAVEGLVGFFSRTGIPTPLVVFALPFITGLLTGLSQAFVGTSFPIILGLPGGSPPDLSLLAFGYVSGFMGVMLSPAHLCVVLTVEHFNADLSETLKLLISPALVLIAIAFGAYLVR